MTLSDKPDLETLAAGVRVSVVQELTRSFGSVDLTSLPEVVGDLEGDVLIASLIRIFRDHPEVLAKGCSYIGRTNQFRLNREHFDLRVSGANLEPNVLEIVLFPVERFIGPDAFTTISTKLTDSGLYRKLRASVPSDVELSLSSISLLSEAVFGTGSRWIEETARDLAGKATSSVGHDLYRTIRQLLPNAAQSDSILLVAFTESKGCYLFDREPADRAIVKLSTKMAGGVASPLSLTAQLLTTVLSYTESHSRHALESMQCIDVSLEKSEYFDSKALFLEAEKVIFESPDISIFPIFSADAGQLVAVFPTKNRTALEPFFKQQARMLTERFLLAKSSLKRLLAVLSQPRRALTYGKTGEVIGGVLKAVFLDP